jgi:hypothetical protein
MKRSCSRRLSHEDDYVFAEADADEILLATKP